MPTMTDLYYIVYVLCLLITFFLGFVVANRMSNATHHLTRVVLLSPMFFAAAGLAGVVYRDQDVWLPAMLAAIPMLLIYIVVVLELKGVMIFRHFCHTPEHQDVAHE